MENEIVQDDIVFFIEDDQAAEEFVWPCVTALLSEAALARDWLRPEEEAAWAHLGSDSEQARQAAPLQKS